MIIIYITYTNLHKETSYIRSKIIIFKYEMMVIKQEMYSHNDKINACLKEIVLAYHRNENTEKSSRNLLIRASKPLAHIYTKIYKYKYIYVNIINILEKE